MFFSGAGISTEYDPSTHANYFVFLEDPEPFWTMHNELTETLENAEPNAAHKAIAKLEKMGKMDAIITQNVDMLHQRAGSGKYEDISIYELHGSYGKLSCIKCGEEYDFEELDTGNVVYPVCDKCSGFIKPNVILFGESLPIVVLESALKSVRNADCLLMIGSSLLVSPANSVPIIAKDNGVRTIFINDEPTPMDDLAEVILRGKADKIFTELMEKLE